MFSVIFRICCIKREREIVLMYAIDTRAHVEIKLFEK